MKSKMTDGEKMVWAATFAREYDTKIHPPHLCYPNKRKELNEWDRGEAKSAIETACYTVEVLSEVEPGIVEGFGEDDKVATMLREMIGKS